MRINKGKGTFQKKVAQKGFVEERAVDLAQFMRCLEVFIFGHK